ncbi:Desmoglein-2 Cadherin family member 5 HDGC [Collichthys lucidus]|uniref:Desmoglein-2 Cadherin family member 5 HDGC n=1 Tax=Collichthys lucidus TaxID=240159 RepID=A0A4U5UWK4_COLLU|nr:Desmoglein-2 Cadherin family member 5 HDGC [Collichthys lucidus]
MAPLLKCSLFILLPFLLTLVPVRAKGNGPVLRRQKREWIVAPRRLVENVDYTSFQSIAKIHSDKTFTKIKYSISGPGVDQPPVGVFGIDPNTGFVKIYSILDREEIAIYHLKGMAKYLNGSDAERELLLKVVVEDQNDCAPVVVANQVGSVNESSAPGTVVMRVIATDADEENTPHSQIFYSIVQESNVGGMFAINSQTGEVMVQRSTLDREYEGSVEENTINVEVLRIQAIDMDLIHTDNWLAVFEIISGNEAGYFSITTDSKTNEGIIMIHKPLDYEKLQLLNLEVAVKNKATYNFGTSMTGSTSYQKSYPIKINVINQKEGPRFHPSVKVVTLSEDTTFVSINKIITTYAAIDSDTLQTATNVRYAKIRDDDNWLIVDEHTADIRLNKLPDRESKYLINGTYYAKIICITNEHPSKTATGTIAIQVEDYNDHCPELTDTIQTMCLDDNALYITAIDKDEFPNSAPFDFSVIETDSKQKWTVEPYNATTAILRDQAKLWPGIYKVAVKVKDQPGKSCGEFQTIDLTVCTCAENTKTCTARNTKTAGLGASGILLLLLGLLLLLLVPLLLLFCLCGGAAALGDFKPIPYDTKQQLISYHTEGQGEDKEVPLLHAPLEVDGGTIRQVNVNTLNGKGYLGGLVDGGGAALGGGATMNTSDLTAENMHMYNRYNQFMGQGDMNYTGAGMMTGQEHLYSRYKDGGVFDGMALSDHFLGEYYSSKSNHAAQQSQQKDSLLVYDHEGQESLAGSVGCCSLLENDDDLAFLNDLGPKFKTLAEICQGSSLVIESDDAGVSSLRPVSPVWPSTSTHTHVHTHKDTASDRDHVNINTLNTSNVASGSSTIIQEERITERAQSSAIPKVHVQDKIMIPTQTVLIQQPTMYYAATPMYVVESKPQMVYVAGGTKQAMDQVGQTGFSQGLVQVGGLQSSQGVVLVDRQVGMGGVTGQVAQGLSQGTASRSRQVLLVEGGSSGGDQVAHLAQGFVQTGHGSTEHGLEVRGQGMQLKTQSFSLGSSGSTGSNEDFALTATPKLQGNQRVVVQHKKVSVTERNVESSMKA